MPSAKRGQNEGSIYKRQDGSWCSQLNLGYANGKRQRKYFYGETRREVAEKLNDALRTHQQGLPVAVERQTVAKFLDRWLADVVKPGVRPSTHQSYAGHVRLYLIPALGKHPLAKLAPQHVQTMLNEQLTRDLSPRTVQYTRAVLRRALGQALKWGLVARNVATLVDPPRSRLYPVRPLTPDQARRLLDAVKGDRLEALYSVAVSLGLRQGEALGLRWDDVDLDAKTLTVRHAMQRVDGKPTFVEPKTNRSRRTISMPASVVTALRGHKVRQLEERLLAGSRWQDWSLVFCSTIGTPLDGSNVTHRFQKHLERAGLPHQRFHDLRHCCASLLLTQDVHPRVVMEILGHSQISLTMNTYSHVVPSLGREAAELMDRIFAVCDNDLTVDMVSP